MLAVVMEPSCHDTSSWTGAVGGKLGGKLFFDFSTDDNFAAKARKLAQEVRLMLPAGYVPKAASRVVASGHLRRAPPPSRSTARRWRRSARRWHR